MSTKPTRLQQQAADHLAEALVLITDAHRLDGKGTLAPAGFDEMPDGSQAYHPDSGSMKSLCGHSSEASGPEIALPGAVDLIALHDDGPDLPRTLSCCPIRSLSSWSNVSKRNWACL